MAELGKWSSVAGTVLSAGGSIYSGIQAKSAADDEAAQLNRRALARRAEAQAGAREERRQSRFKQSYAQARIAAGGGSMADPGVVNYIGDLSAEGEYGALSRLYSGYEEASGYDAAATARRKEGRAARTAGYASGLASAFSGIETLRSKYA